MKHHFIAAGVFLVSLSAARAQNLIGNGSFESPAVPTATITIGVLSVVVPGTETFVDGGTPNAGITDWLVTAGSVSLVNNGNSVVNTLGFPVAPDGSQFAVLNGISINALGGGITATAVGTLSQTFATVAGEAYQLSFDYAGLGLGLGNSSSLQVAVSNSRGSTAPNGGGTINVSLNTFENETFDFVATGTSSTLTFDEPAGSLAHANGVALDDVSVTDLGMTAVPEFPRFGSFAVGFMLFLVLGRLWKRSRKSSEETSGEMSLVQL